MKVRRDDIGVFAQCRPLKPCKITKFERQLQTMAACMAGKGPGTEIKCKIKWRGSLKKRNKIANFAIKAHYGHAVRMREVQWGSVVSAEGKESGAQMGRFGERKGEGG